MVRRGVGVAIASVALAGCGGSGSSDEEKVASVAQELRSAAKRHDGRTLCRDVLHPNTVRAVERLARAQMAPGGPEPTCEQKYRTSKARNTPLEGRATKAEDVTIKGDVAYLPTGEGGRKRAFARRAGDKWKVDFTADPALRWAMRASVACAHWQDVLQAMPLPNASREGIIAHLHSEADAIASFLSALDAESAPGEETEPAQALAGSLDRLNDQLESAAAALRRGGSLESTTGKAAGAAHAEGEGFMRAASAASVECGRIPGTAPDGAEFRRKATAVCTPIRRRIEGLPDPGSSAEAAMRYLRRASVLERRASRGLRALTPPSDLDRVYRDTLATLDGLGVTLRSESAAIARGDSAGARRAVARLGPLDYRKSSGFGRLGLPACAAL
jgi:hypothetical protein